MIKLERVSVNEAARYMGVAGEPDENVISLIERADRLVRERVNPRYIYRETTAEVTQDGIWLASEELLLTGENIKRHLSGCTRVILLAATLSAEADKLIRTAAVTDVAVSLAIDCVCSAAVEQLCDKAEEEIFSTVLAPFRTWRFSPGYGDLPLSVQGDFLRAVDAQRRIGLTVSDSDILIPSKSVTAVIGISDNPVESPKTGCDICKLKGRCGFAAKGVTCKDH